MTKGKDDLGDFEEKTTPKKGEVDQFTDPFKRSAKTQKAADIDGEIEDEQIAKEAPYRVKTDESGEPISKKKHAAVEDVDSKKSSKSKGSKSKQLSA